MKALVKRKQVKVPFKGTIYPLKVMGPVEHPITLTMDKIAALVMASYPVVEVLKDGTEVKLDATNYDKENGDKTNPSMSSKFEVTNFPTGHQIDKTVSSLPPVQTEENIEAMLRASTVRGAQSNSSSYSSNNNNNKNKNEKNEYSANKYQVNDKKNKKNSDHIDTK